MASLLSLSATAHRTPVPVLTKYASVDLLLVEDDPYSDLRYVGDRVASGQGLTARSYRNRLNRDRKEKPMSLTRGYRGVSARMMRICPL